jgi:hypothetical protein
MNWVPALGVTATIAVLAAFLVRTPVTPKAPVPAAVQISDGALIEQVDAEVSETVPDAMAPLTDLVSWDSGQVDEKSVAGKKAVSRKANPAPSVAD